VSFGDGFTPALERLRHQLDDATSDRVLATLSFAHRSGGHRVGTVISSLGVSVSDELRLRRAHAAALTEQRMTATVALAAPWALLSLTIATNPQAADAYRTATGSMVIAIGFVSTGLGFIAARRSARLSGAPRVLR
jgi:Flp pilus assembly protein TadB